MTDYHVNTIMETGRLFENSLNQTFHGFIHRVAADPESGGMTSTGNNLYIVTNQGSVTSAITRGDVLDCDNGQTYSVLKEPFESATSSLMKIYVKRL